MIELSIAIVLVAAMAWDIARRAIAARPAPDALRIVQAEHNQEQIAVDLLALRDELAKTDKVVENISREWLQRFAELEARLPKLEKDVMQKVGGTLANLPSKGYNR